MDKQHFWHPTWSLSPCHHDNRWEFNNTLVSLPSAQAQNERDLLYPFLYQQGEKSRDAVIQYKRESLHRQTWGHAQRRGYACFARRGSGVRIPSPPPASIPTVKLHAGALSRGLGRRSLFSHSRPLIISYCYELVFRERRKIVRRYQQLVPASGSQVGPRSAFLLFRSAHMPAVSEHLPLGF